MMANVSRAEIEKGTKKLVGEGNWSQKLEYSSERNNNVTATLKMTPNEKISTALTETTIIQTSM